MAWIDGLSWLHRGLMAWHRMHALMHITRQHPAQLEEHWTVIVVYDPGCGDFLVWVRGVSSLLTIVINIVSIVIIISSIVINIFNI